MHVNLCFSVEKFPEYMVTRNVVIKYKPKCYLHDNCLDHDESNNTNYRPKYENYSLKL